MLGLFGFFGVAASACHNPGQLQDLDFQSAAKIGPILLQQDHPKTKGMRCYADVGAAIPGLLSACRNYQALSDNVMIPIPLPGIACGIAFGDSRQQGTKWRGMVLCFCVSAA